ncbi:hypothetical protein HOY80DRAFT_1112966 [Tuber brumale]|nr:hypothetical protein HOY80DRAFT_1112966 [Tuber brumale]
MSTPHRTTRTKHHSGGHSLAVPEFTDNDAAPAEPPAPPQPTSISPPKLSYPPAKADTNPNTRPTLPLAARPYIIIASFVCLSAILVYILPSSSSDLFPFYK